MRPLTAVHLDRPPGKSLLDITDRVRAVVRASELAEGICVVFVPHATAGLVINPGSDPVTAADIGAEPRRLVPTRVDFQHTYDTPADAAGHVKVTLTGSSLSLIVSGGELVLGRSQCLMRAEFATWRRPAATARCRRRSWSRRSARCSRSTTCGPARSTAWPRCVLDTSWSPRHAEPPRSPRKDEATRWASTSPTGISTGERGDGSGREPRASSENETPHQERLGLG
jgi:secondary thiamine-phosphate synthase enzyme